MGAAGSRTSENMQLHGWHLSETFVLISDYANKQLCRCYQLLCCDAEHMFPVAGKCLLQELQSSTFPFVGPAVKSRLNATHGWLGKGRSPSRPPQPSRHHLSPFPMWLELLRLFA